MCDPVSALVAVSVGTGLASANEARKSRKASQRANEVQSRIQERRSQRERIQALREARIVNAQLDTQAAITGTQSSSAVQGASANIQQQLGTNLSFVEQIQGLQKQAQVYQQSAANAASRASTYNAIGNLALQGASFVGNAPSGANTTGNASTGATVPQS